MKRKTIPARVTGANTGFPGTCRAYAMTRKTSRTMIVRRIAVFMCRQVLPTFILACALMVAGFVGLAALADKCASAGGDWCWVSPIGDGRVNPYG